MGNHIFVKLFLNIDRKAPKLLLLLYNYIRLYKKAASGFDFGLWEVPKQENMHFHFHAFSGWGTSPGPKSNPKAVFYLSLIKLHK